MTAYHIAIMNGDIGKFGHDSMQQRTKQDKIYEIKLKFLTCNVFVLKKVAPYI